MGFELPDGKTARNIQEQVKFLTEKLKDLYARVNDLEIKIEVVDELPEEGVEGTIYLVPAENPDLDNYYEEYLYIDGAFELIGTTQIDLSGYVDLTSAQTITGVKTFANGLNVDTGEGSTWSLINDSDWYLDIYENAVRKFTFTPDAFIPRAGQDLGESNNKWKDLYLSGNINLQNPNYSGTHSQIFESQYGRLFFKTDGSNAMEIQSANIVFSRTLIGNNLDLGNSSYKWKDLYLSGAIKNSDKINLRPNSVSYDLFSVSSSEVLTWVGIRPAANGSLNLGTATSKWQDLYLSGNLSDGTNTVSVAAISKTRLYLHRFQFTYTGGGGYLNVITNSATSISDTESNFQTAINSAVSVYVNQSDNSRALFLSASLSQNDCRWFTSAGAATGGSVSFGSESISEIQ